MCNPDDSGHCDPNILRHHVSPLQTQPALVGWLSVLECAFWGFLPLFALLHLFPLFRLFVTSFAEGPGRQQGIPSLLHFNYAHP